MTNRPDSPGVKLPPPALYALAVLGGYFLNRPWPLPMSEARPSLNVLAAIVMAASLLLMWSSIGRFRRSKTSIVPIRPATALVIAGPYRFTRNPMYVGMAMLTVALALFMDSWWPVVLLIPVLLVVRVFVIAPEERYLFRRFGAAYEEYTLRVRRWM